MSSRPSPDAWGERLPRRLGLGSAIAVVVGSTIGSGIFRTPAIIADRIPSLTLFASAWILGSVVALAGALSYAELAAMMPRSGGLYVYLRRAYGDLTAFLFGWTQLLILRPSSYGAIGLTCAEYGWRIFGLESAPLGNSPFSLVQVTAAVLIVTVALINIRGIKLGAAVQNVSTVLKIAALLVLVGIGFIYGGALDTTTDVALTEPPVVGGSWWTAFGLAMVPVLWSYDGWSDVGFIAGEIKEPQRNAPRAFIIGSLTVGLLYLAVNLAYLLVVPLSEMPGSKLVAADVAQVALGVGGAAFVAGAIALSTFGTLNGTMMTGPRIFYAMAEDDLFFKTLARVHPRYATPSRCIMLAAALGVFFVSFRGFKDLADQFVIGIWPFYALGTLSVLLLRHKHPEWERPYRTWGYPVMPAIFLLAALFVLGNYLISETALFFVSLAVIGTGVPIYWLWLRIRKSSGGQPV